MLVAVENVFGVVHHFETVRHQELHRVTDHGDALFELDSKRFGHVIVPTLADDADRRGASTDQVLQCLVLVDLAPRTSS